MNKSQQRAYAHNCLLDWVEFRFTREERSCLGYPKQTAEARAAAGCVSSGLKPGSKDPELMMSPRVSAVDRAMKTAPDKYKTIVLYVYGLPGTFLKGQRLQLFMHDTGRSSGTYYRWAEEALDFIYRHLQK